MGTDKSGSLNDTISCQPGTRAKIEVPVEVKKGSVPSGCFPAKEIIIEGTTYTLTRGFRVENTEIGTVTVTEDQRLAVWYEHKKEGPNRVLFYSVDGRTAVVNIVSVPVHTHQSINQGGPAYGTYFRDKKEDTGE